MKLNKILISTAIAALSLGFYSCEDAYEIEPIGILDDEAFFRSVEDAQMFLNNTYLQLNNMSSIYFTAVFTDEAKPGPSYNGTERDLHNFILNSTTGQASSIWLNGHTAINRANRLLAGAELINVTTDAEQAALNNVVAQAKFIRAFANLNLISYFSPDMKSNDALGGMYFTHVPTSDEKLPRGTNGQIYSLIEDDLNYALANLSNSNNFIIANKAAVEALFARMYAYRGMYDMAKVHAQNVINNYGIQLAVSTPYDASNFYHYTNTTNPYRMLWVDAPSGTFPTLQSENVFSLQTMPSGAGFSPASLFYANNTRMQGSPYWAMGLNQYGVLIEDANDVRQFAFVDPTTDLSIDAVMIDKYPGISIGGGQLRNNLKLIRLSEMYLILAEAAVSSGNLGEAAGYIHQIKVARSITGTADVPVYGSPTEAWAGILNERRKELCFEGHRYVDLRRLGALAGVSIDRNFNDNEVSSQATTLPITDHRFTLPVPFDEIVTNPNIIQNPGY